MHAYGTTQVFNPIYTGEFKRLVFMDIDTFLIRNVDELFCATGFAAAKRLGVAGFNGGVFSFEPSAKLYDTIFKSMLKYMQEPGEKKFAMQTLLHRTFGEKFFCVDIVYNCHGLCGDNIVGCKQLSSKCGINDEQHMFARGAIIHAKISDDHVAEHIPQLRKMWSEYGPVGETLKPPIPQLRKMWSEYGPVGETLKPLIPQLRKMWSEYGPVGETLKPPAGRGGGPGAKVPLDDRGEREGLRHPEVLVRLVLVIICLILCFLLCRRRRH